jgi:predicted molibdopterin-dependent oxidoreductase YjgC
VQLVRPAIPSPGEARADWAILAEIGGRLQKALGGDTSAPYAGWEYTGPEQVLAEIAALTPSYGGITFERVADKGLQWPCPNTEHPGTPILHVGKFSRGLGKFNPVEHAPSAELPDSRFPLILTTGRVLQHYHTGTMTRRVEGLNALVPEERVEMNARDAETLGVADGDWVTVTSRRGQVRARARVDEKIKPGTVFMTFHFAEALGNVLTNPALDPVAKIPELKVCAVKVEKA